MSDDNAILDDIGALRDQVDIVIVQLHWGYEWTMHPLLSHRDRARRFADAGADIVLCHHAHVPMAVEAWNGRLIAHGQRSQALPPGRCSVHTACCVSV